MRLISLFLALFFSFFMNTNAAITLSDKPVGFVTDFTSKLNVSEKQALEAKLAAYKASTSNEIVVVIIPSPMVMGEAALSTAAQAIADKWKPGMKDKNNGLIILVSGTAEPYKVRIATGRGLEGALPDILANKIVQEVIKPKMNSGAFYEGLDQGIDAITTRIGTEFTADKKHASDKGMSIVAIAGILLLAAVIAFFVGMLSVFISTIVGAAAVWLAFSFGWLLLLGASAGLGLGFLGRIARNATTGGGSNSSDGGGAIFYGGGGSSSSSETSIAEVVSDVVSAAGDFAGGGGGDD